MNVFLEALADTAKIREGLQDEEAQPLIEWGTRYAQWLAARLDSPGAAPPDTEQVKTTAHTLVRLMTRLTWLVTYRHKKDAAWLTQTFQMVNKLNQDLLGTDAPVFTDEEITAWLTGHNTQTNGALLQNLVARLTPPALAPVTPESAPEKPAPSQPTSLKPLSDALFGKPLSSDPTPDSSGEE
jgi:hypothetical protein